VVVELVVEIMLPQEIHHHSIMMDQQAVVEVELPSEQVQVEVVAVEVHHVMELAHFLVWEGLQQPDSQVLAE
jgi:desulfoferrodoxin (superoxide reductase-like protein)